MRPPNSHKEGVNTNEAPSQGRGVTEEETGYAPINEGGVVKGEVGRGVGWAPIDEGASKNAPPAMKGAVKGEVGCADYGLPVDAIVLPGIVLFKRGHFAFERTLENQHYFKNQIYWARNENSNENSPKLSQDHGGGTSNCTRTTCTRTLHQDIPPFFCRILATYRHFPLFLFPRNNILTDVTDLIFESFTPFLVEIPSG